MKAYTDLEQSKKLAEILPFESADMYYYSYMSIGEPFYMSYPNVIEDRQKLAKNDIPCWSLAALLNVLPKNLNIGRPALNSNYKGYYWIQYYDEFMKSNNYNTECFNNPIDACVEMIVFIKENGNI